MGDLNHTKGVTVELTHPNIVHTLLSAVHQHQAKPAETPRKRRARCHCGVCTLCVDNARWETIFNAKFADPDYYKSRPVRGGSSLDWMRPNGRPATARHLER